MFGPVEGTGHQLDGGGIHDLDEAFETEGEFRAAVATEVGLDGLQMIQHGPEELFGQLGVTGAVGVGEGVFGWWRGAAQSRERAGVKAQSVANVVETEAVSQLGIKQTDDLAPGRGLAPLIFDAGVAGQLGHLVRRNQIAKLAENGELAGGWLVVLLFHALPCGKAQTRKPTFFILKPKTYESAVIGNHKFYPSYDLIIKRTPLEWYNAFGLTPLMLFLPPMPIEPKHFTIATYCCS